MQREREREIYFKVPTHMIVKGLTSPKSDEVGQQAQGRIRDPGKNYHLLAGFPLAWLVEVFLFYLGLQLIGCNCIIEDILLYSRSTYLSFNLTQKSCLWKHPK